MSTPNTSMTLAEKSRAIDAAAAGAMDLFRQAGSFQTELALAQALQDLRALLTPEIMTPIMGLMNTDIGFRTDRDPKLPRKDKDGNWTKADPYPVDVVRDVVIEARLRGFHIAGNEFNIIAGKFYAAKNGFRRKLTDGKTFPTLTNFRDNYEVPRVVGDKGAVVKCKAEWKFDGMPETMEAEIPVKMDGYSTADQVLGKAERKFLKRIVDRLAGTNTPEGEVGDEPLRDVTSRQNALPRPTQAQQEASREGPVTVATTATIVESVAEAKEHQPSTQLKLIRKQLGIDGISESAAVSAIYAMFPESEGCRTLDEMDEMMPNIINATVRKWAEFKASSKAKNREQP